LVDSGGAFLFLRGPLSEKGMSNSNPAKGG
jgi:hypothetical protein